MTYYGISIFIIAVIIVLVVNNSNIIIHPIYLFNFINKHINYKTKELDRSKILIDDDGLDSLSLEDLKRKRKKDNIILFYVKFSINSSYLYRVFKDDYIILCRKINKIYKPGNFIVVVNQGNYYIREVYSDNKNNKVAVFSPEKENSNIELEYINRMDIVGEVINYNKYRLGLI